MASKDSYLLRLKLAVEHLHNCAAYYLRTETVHETFNGQTVWVGEVVVFSLVGQPKARRCFAWSHKEGDKDERERFVAVLAIPPVTSAETAVRASIVADGKKQQS